MIKDIMDDIISERKSKNIEDDYGIQNCWNKMIDILSNDKFPNLDMTKDIDLVEEYI